MKETLYYGLLMLNAFCAGAGVTFAVLNWLAWRRSCRLNVLLDDLCLSAWHMRHLPIWVAWSELTGLEFQVRLRPRTPATKTEAEAASHVPPA